MLKFINFPCQSFQRWMHTQDLICTVNRVVMKLEILFYGKDI